MKRVIIVVMASLCLGLMAQAEEMGEQVEDAKPKKEKVKKEKKAKAPKVKKEKKPAAPKEKKEKKPKQKPVIEEMTIKGVVTKMETKKGEKVNVSYILTDGEGNKIRLPKPKKPKKGEAGEALNMDDYVDAGVTVTAKGFKVKKGEKETTMIKELLGIEKEGGVEEVQVFSK